MFDVLFGAGAGWLFAAAADKVVETMVANYREPEGSPIDDLIDDLSDEQFTSRFANTRKDVETVLALRRHYFRKHVVVPDRDYRCFWTRNRFSLKVVYDDTGSPVGYWSATPIDAHSFDEFCRGHRSHRKMLRKASLPWSSIGEAPGHLYIVGAVVPLAKGTGAATAHRMISRRVLLDSFSFAVELMSHVTIRGVCGYPSRNAGAGILRKLELQETTVFVDNDPFQPIFVISDEQQVLRLRNNLQAFCNRWRGLIPSWDSEDRSRFLAQLTAHNPGE